MDKFFKLSERKTDVRTEVMAGLTTFLTMAYILAVEPGMLSSNGMGMAFEQVFSATCLASAIATLVMGLWADLPFVLAPGMGLNAFMVYTVCLGMGYDWKFALSAVFVEGIIFLILTACNIREAIINSIPSNLKKAISVGIGFFIAFIGLVNAGIVKGNASTLVELNPQWLSTPGPIVAVIGLVIMIVLMVKRVKGAMLIGILATTVIGIPLGVTNYAGGSFAPHAPYFFPFEFAHMASFDFITVCFTFLFVDMFDTVGTLIGCSTKAGLLKEDGSIPHVKEALFADAVGTTVGAILGCSTVTTFVESSAGVVEGGKTGLTAVTAAILFLLAMFLSPIFESIPSAATAPALILVGVLMVSPIKDLEFDDLTELVPAYLCILFMVVTYSISNGILIGILGYTVLKLFTGKGKDITVMTWVVAILFILEIIFSPLV